MSDTTVKKDTLCSESFSEEVDLAKDILRGADQIAEFIFGTPKARRRIYHLVETTKLPVFRLGATVCARRSKLLNWIAAQEARTEGR